jgi:hypothetical protein
MESEKKGKSKGGVVTFRRSCSGAFFAAARCSGSSAVWFFTLTASGKVSHISMIVSTEAFISANMTEFVESALLLVF